MSNTYTWKILNLETVPSIDGLENVVSIVRWLLTAANDTKSTTVEGTVELDNPLADGFIVYAELSEDQVLTWVKDKLGNDLTIDYYRYLDQQLEKLKKSVPVVTDLPWS